MAKSLKLSTADRTRSIPRVGVAAAAAGVLAVALAGAVLWLALSADTTMDRLRAEADRTSLTARVILPVPIGGAGAEAPPPAELSLNTAMAQPVAGNRPPPGTRETPALPPAPAPGLVEQTADGALPKIGADGRLPRQVYARPFDAADTRPRIAVVVTDMGHADAATNTAIRRLPPPVTLAFTPYARDLDAWLKAARTVGHETLMMLPMEPDSYPRDDPGPHTLLTSLGPANNRGRLEWVLGRGVGYVGVITEMGSRFTLSEEALSPVLTILRNRGLLLLDNSAAANSRAGTVGNRVGLPVVANDRRIDAVVDRDTIDLRLQELEEIARQRGVAVGLAGPLPLTFERLAAWFPTLERKGIVLVPVSAVIERPTAG